MITEYDFNSSLYLLNVKHVLAAKNSYKIKEQNTEIKKLTAIDKLDKGCRPCAFIDDILSRWFLLNIIFITKHQ
jgi:hypothetical protein